MINVLRRHWIALIILCLFVGLGVLYSVATPIFEASDELNHYPFVQTLVRGNGLPVQRPDQATLWGQEGSQPPLYYGLAAIATAWIDTGDMAQLLDLNPHAERGVPLASDNKNMVIHDRGDELPWHGTALAVHLIRILSIWLAAGTVLCTYLLVLELFPQRLAIALAAMAINAFLPMFLFISASVNNDTLVVLLSSLTLLLLVRMLQRGTSPRSLLAIGMVIGLASLSKLSALGLIPLAGLALALRFFSSQWPPRLQGSAGGRQSFGPAVWRWVKDYALVLLPVIAVAGWWYWRNWQLYGDPTGLNAMLAIAGRRVMTPSWRQLLGEFQGFRINFWGLFGGVNILMRPAWVYPLLDLLTVAAAIGLVIWAWRVWRPQRFDQWPAVTLVAAWIAVVFVALIRWTSSTMASQGRLVFPAISGICLFLALGWLGWLSPRRQPTAALGVGGLMLVLALAAPFAAIRPAYARPSDLIAASVPADAQRFDVDYDGVARLLAFEVDKERMQPGDEVTVTLYWQALKPITDTYSVYVQVYGWQQNLGQHDSYPAGGAYPTDLWTPGQIIRDRHQITIPPDATGPSPARISAGLYRFDTMERSEAVDSAGGRVDFPILTQLILDAPAAARQPSHPLDANLDNHVRLVGFDAQTENLQPGQEWPVTLYWHSQGPLDKDYTVFVHLVDGNGVTVAQGDGPPLQQFYPTSAWVAGEILNDPHSVALPQDIPPGQYRLFVGLYDPVSGYRLPVLDQADNMQDNQVLVTTVDVSAAP